MTYMTMSSDSQQMFPVMAPDHFHQYSNAWPQHSQQVSVRQYPSTSSAFSSSAHPDEDWTKVSDLAERRRIQNRIAQRNYRKKIKERMADLERRAGTEGTKSQTSTKKLPKSSKKSRRQSSPPPTTSDTLAPPHQVPHNPFTPPMHPEDHFFPSPSPPASTPPSSSNYHSTYSPPSDSGLIMPPFGSPQSQPMSTTAPYQFGMVTTTAPTLPPMNFFADAYKAPNLNGGNESMSSFPGYGDYTLGVPPSHYDSNPHTPSLSPCLEHSECISEAGWSAYPATPLSMGSP